MILELNTQNKLLLSKQRVLTQACEKEESFMEELVRGNEKCHLTLVPGSKDQSEGHSSS
jgi:hypothetical protein